MFNMKKFLGILLVIAIIGLIIFLLLHFKGIGWGVGNGRSNTGSESSSVSNDKNTSSDNVQSSEIESTTEPIETTVEEVIYVAVTVQGRGYLYQNSGIELDDLIDELKKIEGNFIIRITDENASKKAFDDLTSALDEYHIPYEEVE